MILAEPPRTNYDLNFRLLGVRVRVHPLFWLVMILLGSSFFRMPGVNQLAAILLWLAAALVSLVIHEFGHVFAFRYYRVDSYVVMHAFGGLAIPYGSGYGGMFAPRLNPKQNAVVAFAGPAAEIASALLLLLVLHLTGNRVSLSLGGLYGFSFDFDPRRLPFYFALFVNMYVGVSLFWGLINLLPIIPLDGGKISHYFFDRFDPNTGLKQALILSIIACGFIALYMIVRVREPINAMLFAYLGFMNFQALQALNYGGRDW